MSSKFVSHQIRTPINLNTFVNQNYKQQNNFPISNKIPYNETVNKLDNEIMNKISSSKMTHDDHTLIMDHT